MMSPETASGFPFSSERLIWAKEMWPVMIAITAPTLVKAEANETTARVLSLRKSKPLFSTSISFEDSVPSDSFFLLAAIYYLSLAWH